MTVKLYTVFFITYSLRCPL